ncbi:MULTISPECIES: GlcG/HbpS family heme-binding protein [Bradyrhizobium]|uniref:GlcG/HbpS family heme-binding protein n=1 Tax=Bradyrhizobium elkanii TaxID=29448 RepID=UPI00041BFE76|nr:heme-binding protein [Bradyrhizobium elkanii]
MIYLRFLALRLFAFVPFGFRHGFATWIIACVAALTAGAASAQQPLPPGVPEKMPADIPYGTPISLDLARQAVEAAFAESSKRGWKMAIAVVSPSGDLTYFVKMDDTMLASPTIAQNKARTAARFRRDTKGMFDLTETGHPYVMTLDPTLVASPGGMPIISEGKVIGAIGCSGGAGVQDAVVCQAGIEALIRK